MNGIDQNVAPRAKVLNSKMKIRTVNFLSVNQNPAWRIKRTNLVRKLRWLTKSSPKEHNIKNLKMKIRMMKPLMSANQNLSCGIKPTNLSDDWRILKSRVQRLKRRLILWWMLGVFQKKWPTFLNFLKCFSLLFENEYSRFSPKQDYSFVTIFSEFPNNFCF